MTRDELMQKAFDAIVEAEETDSLKALFLDGWGTAVVEKGHVWMKERIRGRYAAEGLKTTNSWSPGQHNVDIRLQRDLFGMLKPEDIGVTLTESLMMHPKKSVSSFTGAGASDGMEDIRACDFCTHRETCPSAYV